MLNKDERATLKDRYRANGIVRIPAFLASERASELHRLLHDRSDWIQLFNSGDKLFELDRVARASLDDARQAALDQAIYAGAREGFQYRYETIRVPDEEAERRQSSDPLAHLALELSSGAVRALFREITGEPEIRFADAQATAFSPGDFLTGHDDRFAGKNRRAAYVLGLTPVWRIEWGGLLVVHGEDGEAALAYPPMMNLLTLFRVPLMHSVSEVTRAAAYRRYSVTGWLRA